MRVEDGGGAYVRIVLSRRNLMSLLAKLDGHPRPMVRETEIAISK